MDNFHDPKRLALRLREALAEKNIKLTQGEALNIVARQFGLKEWNVLSAQIKAGTEPIAHLKLPTGWLKTGQSAQLFDAGIDPSTDYLGKPTVVLKSNENDLKDGFVTVMQTINAERYHSKRIAISAMLRASDVVGSATIWLRVDGEKGVMLAFNNLETQVKDGSISGTVDWVKRDIVLEVSADAVTVNFGFYLQGQGTVGFRILISGKQILVKYRRAILRKITRRI